MDEFMGYEKLKTIVGLWSKVQRSMKGIFANVTKKFRREESREESPRLIGNQGRRERERRMRQMQKRKGNSKPT